MSKSPNPLNFDLTDQELLQKLREGLEDIEAGRTIPANIVFENLQRTIRKPH